MILIWLIVILLGGGIIAWISERYDRQLPRWISLIATVTCLIILIVIWISCYDGLKIGEGSWLIRFSAQWIPTFGIEFHVALDGLSLLMLLLTAFLGVLAVLTSWEEIKYREGFYYFNLLWVLAGITGVFLTMDLFLFYFFWEVMLIPMYFLIVIWGHENRRYAAYKFFIFTQASGLLMLLAILGLYFIHGEQTGTYTFNYFELLTTKLSTDVAWWLMLGFLTAFVVKLPVVPLHSWLPDAHSQAPTAGSLILAGLLLKTGAYGLLRFILPIFPSASREFAPWAMILGVAGIIYGAVLAFSQTDLKRLVAYTSVSHMGFVMLGVFAFTDIALQGVVMQIITHGISTGALFIIAGILSHRIHSRDLKSMGGFWATMPYMGSIALIFVMASLGLPGLGNFIAEFLTLMGTWPANRTLTVCATLGLVGATIYSLRVLQKIFYGPINGRHTGSQAVREMALKSELQDLSPREKLVLLPMVIVIIWLGIFPQPVLNTYKADRHEKTALKRVERSQPIPIPENLSVRRETPAK